MQGRDSASEPFLMGEHSSRRAARSLAARQNLVWLPILFVLASLATSCSLPSGPEGLPTPPPATTILPTSTPLPLPEQPLPTPPLTTDVPGEVSPDFAFAMFLPVPTDKAFAGNEEAIRATFKDIKALGGNTVGQLFSPDSNEADWKAYLDVAAEEGLRVIAAFTEEPPRWDSSDFDLRINGRFLEAMKDHPALYSIIIVDEPFHQKHDWQITSERLQALYRQFKRLAPNVLVHVGFSREIMRAERGDYQPGYAFGAGMCDVCAISTLEFRNFGPGNRFDIETATENHSTSRAVIQREDPDVQIWTTIQVFGSRGTTEGRVGSTYYMPSPAELQQMVDLLLSSELQASGELNGIIWQQWGSRFMDQDESQLTLGDPEFEELRKIVRETALRLGLPVPTD